MASSVISRAAGLGTLTAAGQLIVIGTLPMYSKIFDPAAYGEYVVFVGSVGVVGVLAGVRYESAIVLPRDDRIAAALSALVVLIALTVAAFVVIATLLTWTFAWRPAEWMRIERQFGYGLAVATVVGALQRCLTGWCIRGGRFMRMGSAQFVLSLVTVVVQLSLARVMGQLSALIWGYVLALGAQTACLAAPGVHANAADWARAMSFRSMRVVARKYRRFPTYMVGYALASSVRDRLIQVAFGIGAGAAVVGRFGLAYRVAFAPNSLIYSAVSPLFFALASRGGRLEVGRFAAGVVEAVFVLLLVPYVAFAIEAPALTDTLLSDKWHGTGPYLQALAAPALLLSATCWLDRAFDSFRRQNVAFALEASFTVISVALTAGLSRVVNAMAVAWAFGTLGAIYYWTYFLLTFVACGFPMADFRRACLTGIFGVAAALSLGLLAHRLPLLSLRVSAYVLLMVLVILAWIRFREGAAVIRLLLQSRISTGGAVNPANTR